MGAPFGFGNVMIVGDGLADADTDEDTDDEDEVGGTDD